MRVPVSRDLLLIDAAAFLRSFAFGLTGVVLGIYLFRVGLSSFSIGMIIAAGLVGSAALSTTDPAGQMSSWTG